MHYSSWLTCSWSFIYQYQKKKEENIYIHMGLLINSTLLSLLYRAASAQPFWHCSHYCSLFPWWLSLSRFHFPSCSGSSFLYLSPYLLRSLSRVTRRWFVACCKFYNCRANHFWLGLKGKHLLVGVRLEFGYSDSQFRVSDRRASVCERGETN